VQVKVPWHPDTGYPGEVSGWVKLGSKYFVVCDGAGTPPGGNGWISKVFVSDQPQGPYSPTKRNYNISNSPAIYDKLHYSANGELLTEAIVWTFEKTRWHYHLPPFMTVISDGGNLWFRWWTGNEKLKVHPIPMDLKRIASAKSQPIVLLENRFDIEKGLVIEGNVTLASGHMPR
jgi:hypothetical protein